MAANEDRVGIINATSNATRLFGSLFKIYLSGTETPAIERLKVIDDALASGDSERRRIAMAPSRKDWRHGISRDSETRSGKEADRPARIGHLLLELRWSNTIGMSQASGRRGMWRGRFERGRRRSTWRGIFGD